MTWYDLVFLFGISGVYCESSDLQFIVKSKMDAILHIYYKNNDVILNTKQNKACYNILWLNTVSSALQPYLTHYVVYF